MSDKISAHRKSLYLYHQPILTSKARESSGIMSIIDNDLPVTPSTRIIESGDGRAPKISYPMDDLMNNFSFPAKKIFDSLRKMSEYEAEEADELKPTAAKYLLPKPIVEHRRGIISALLPLKAIPLILLNAIQLGVKFDDDLPYAVLYWVRSDLRRVAFMVYDRNDCLLGKAFDATSVWKFWTDNNAFSEQQMTYIQQNHKCSTKDDRLFRGWGTIVLEIGEETHLFNELIPAYYRESQSMKKIPKEMQDLIAKFVNLDFDDDDAPEPPSKKVIKRERETSPDLVIYNPFERHNHENNQLITSEANFTSKLFELLSGKIKDPVHIRDQITKKTYQMNAEQLEMLGKMQDYMLNNAGLVPPMGCERPLIDSAPSYTSRVSRRKLVHYHTDDDDE